MTLSETHIVDRHYDDVEGLFIIDGYKFIKQNRKQGRAGSVAVYIKDNILWKRRYDLETDNIESIWLEIFIAKSKSILIATFYRPPESSVYLPNDFNKTFNDMLLNGTKENKEIIILRDFNADYLKPNDNKEIKGIFQLFGFKQLIKTATRITKESSTLIDLIATNNPQSISKSNVFATSISDHDMVGCIRKINHFKYSPKVITRRNYATYNVNNMNNDFEAVDWEPVYNTNDVNVALNNFHGVVKTIFDRHAPFIVRRIKGKSCPWMHHDLRKIMTDRDRLLTKARKTKNIEDWNMYKRLRNKCNNQLKSAKSSFQRNLLEQNTTNPKKFWKVWKVIKDVFPFKNNSTPNKSCNNTTDENQKHLSDIFSSYYATAARSLKEKSIVLMDFVWRWSKTLPLRTTNCFKWRCIPNSFVLRELKQLKRQKAFGVDNLPSGMLKDCREYIYQPLGYIINLSFQSSKVPSMWKTAKVIPIHKKGAHNEPENYRPISVLPVLSKVLERAVHQQLSEFLKEQNLLTKYQFGYRSNRSTNLVATLFLDDIRREVDVGNMVGAVFIDLSKAFDTLGHSILLSKLPAYGVHDNELLWFTDYLFGRQQYVQLGKVTLSMRPIYSGVPQGSILGPLLFNLYFNDFVDHLLRVKVLMYADDTVIYCAGKDIECIENVLTRELEHVARYFDENELVINLKKGKTEVMLFGTAKRRSLQNRQLNITYRDAPINNSNE